MEEMQQIPMRWRQKTETAVIGVKLLAECSMMVYVGDLNTILMMQPWTVKTNLLHLLCTSVPPLCNSSTAKTNRRH